MNHLKVVAVLLLAVAFFVFHSGVFASMPKLSVTNDDVLVVGEPPDDYARYDIGQRRNFSSTSLGYDFQSRGGSLIGMLGGRGVISYIAEGSYKSAMRTSCTTGQCFGSTLPQNRVGHLILIPQDKAALNSMKVRLPMGESFRLSGRSLDLREVRKDGQPAQIGLNGTGCFLVESITKE